MLPKPCRVCGKPGKSICDKCVNSNKQPQRSKPSRQSRGYNNEYDRNRRIVIDIAWSHNEPCCLCGNGFIRKEDISAEHVIPLRNGGSNTLSNLAPAHKSCNYAWRRKHTPAVMQ